MGVGVKDAHLMRDYHAKFVSYLETHHNARILSEEKTEMGLMPRITPEFRVDLGKGRVILAGDAAYLLNPMGEGISSALASSYAAAEAIKAEYDSDKHVNPLNILDRYKDSLKGEIDYMKRQSRFLSTISPEYRSIR
jgi:flavin-dependent dehydrogenase